MNAPTQLGLDGHETPYPPPVVVPLSDRQRELVRWLRMRGVVRPIEVGRIMHAGREYGDNPRYYSSDGAAALKRLERRGLVERLARGQWRLRIVDWGSP